jgi:hypothetical protein
MLRGTGIAVGALERTDECIGFVTTQWSLTGLAVGAQFEHGEDPLSRGASCYLAAVFMRR